MVSSVGARIGGLGRAARGANTDTHAAPEETHAAARGAAGAAGWRWAWARAGARAHAHAHVRTRTRHDRLHCDVRSETESIECPLPGPAARRARACGRAREDWCKRREMLVCGPAVVTGRDTTDENKRKTAVHKRHISPHNTGCRTRCNAAVATADSKVQSSKPNARYHGRTRTKAFLTSKSNALRSGLRAPSQCLTTHGRTSAMPRHHPHDPRRLRPRCPAGG